MTHSIGTIHRRWETNTRPLNLETDILHTALAWLSMELILKVKFLFFQLPLVHNDSGNAWCVKYIKIQGDRYMNQIKVKLRLNQTMKHSYQLSCCHLRSCLRFVLIADDLLKYDLCSWPNQNSQKFSWKKNLKKSQLEKII